jgi:hypothetical protein
MARRKSIAVLAAVLIVGGLAAAGALAAPQRVSANSASYTDPMGDTGTAPDITAVSVSNDDAGAITFTVTISGRTELGPNDDIAIVIDHDRSEDTGLMLEGWDYFIDLTASGAKLFTITELGDLAPVGASSLVASYANGAATFQINRSDLGGTGCFAFYVASETVQGVERVHDDAPDGDDYWVYDLKLPVTAVGIEMSRPYVSKARAGRTFQVSAKVSRKDTGAGVNGQVTCSARLGGKTLRKSGRSSAGFASCSWTLPKSARGKWLGGTISVNYQGATAKRSFAAKVS